MTSRLSSALQCARPCPEARIEAHRSFARVADRALDFLEIARGEIMALLQVGAFCGSFTGCVGRDRIELAELAAELAGELALATADLLQPIDQIGTLAVGFFEQPAKYKRELVRAIPGQGLSKACDRG